MANKLHYTVMKKKVLIIEDEPVIAEMMKPFDLDHFIAKVHAFN